MTAEPVSHRVMVLLSDLGTGGTARVTLLVVNGLAALGVNVSLVLMSGGSVLAPQLDQQVRVIELNAAKGRGPAMLRGLPRLVRLIREERPGWILSAGNHMHVIATLAHALARVRGCKLALKLTNSVERNTLGAMANGVRRNLYKWMMRQADRVLLIAQSTRDEIARADPAIGGKLRVVDNPYVTDAMIATGEFVPGRLLAIGRLVPQKNYPLLLDALARIADRSWTLDVLGDGPLLASLQDQARSLGIEQRVTFHGFVADPTGYLQQAHALLLSSSWEGQGAVLLEALACGCPAIATRSTAAVAAALGDGRYGRLVPPDDPAALADAISAELDRRSTVEAAEWVARYRIEAGVRSHVRALDLRLEPSA